MDNILQPVVVLLGWSMVMWIWMYATRLPAMQKADIDIPNLIGSTGGDLDRLLDAKTQWKAHNYNHLMEQPTLFYAAAIILYITGYGDGVNNLIAWGYVITRILHSLIQSLVNRVTVRFGVFVLSSLCLMALIVHAAWAVF